MSGAIIFVSIALAVLLPLAWWVSAGARAAVRAAGIAAALGATAAVYLAIGAPALVAPPADPVDALAAKLEERLDQDPTNVEGWRMLGRLRVSQARWDAGAEAYAKARALSGDEDAAALVGYAEARLLGDPSRLTTEVAPLLERALALAPDDPRALWYGGHLANERGDRALAEQRWRKLLEQPVPPELRHAIEMQLGQGAAPPGAAPVAAGGSEALFELEVEVAPALAAKLPAGAPLFVFVREGTGRAPLVVKRVASYTLPARFVLTRGDLLGGIEALDAARSLTAGVRVSTSGTASRTAGDLEGTATIVRGAGGAPGRARVVIDAEVR